MASGTPLALEMKGTVRDPRVGLQDVHVVALDRELDVDQTAHVQGSGQLLGSGGDLLAGFFGEGGRWSDTGGIPRMHSGLLDMLHDPAQQELGSVEDGVHVHLHSPLQEPVDEDRGTRQLGIGVGILAV